ncbi:alpha/beta fold hydrolase [Microbacteriaceae bacterium VKM Ac-2854]|nr:alpha/beta fold hydrolase [Microbacteriaceae bacterium VKM Ac-2854]
MTVLLLHGLGSDRSSPLGLFSPLFPADAEILAPDLRAHGASAEIGTSADFALDALADEVTEFLIRSGAAHKPLTVLGISMGAAIALRLTVRGVLPIDHAAFVRPSFSTRPMPEHLAVFPVIAQLLHDHGAVRGERMFRGTGLFENVAATSPVAAEALAQQFRAPLAVERAVRLVEVPRNAAYADPAELAGITASTIVVAADRDPVHPVAVGEEWATALPGAELVRVPGRDEGVARQHDETRRLLANWLARRPTTA